MTASKNCNQQLFDNSILTHDNAPDLFANAVACFHKVVRRGGVVFGFNGRWLDQN
jgi:hypothetical protein